MCGVTAGPQRHFYLLLHALPRQYVVLQVTIRFILYIRKCSLKTNFHACEDKELTKNVTEVEPQ